jgi:hypothetical protein
MDAICGLNAEPTQVSYFAYGSNMDREQMASRAPNATFAVTATLDGFQVVFNKAGADGSAKANIQQSFNDGTVVLGCLYELSGPDFASLTDFETGYSAVQIKVNQNGAKIRARTLWQTLAL